jgi:serine/threonine-protein kinase
MGEVYRARDTRLDRTIAVKVLKDWAGATDEMRQRFEREARAVSSLNHPHICTLYDVGRHNGIDFLVIEFVEGETLAARLARGPLPLDQALDCAREITEALDHAHRRGVIHRDLKPSNVMLTKSGVKLLDFGLAKVRPETTDKGGAIASLATQPMRSSPITREGTLLGTVQYMAPEQLEGKEADTRSDLFAFGTVLYEMVTGRRAFDGKSPASVIAAILGSEPPALSAFQPMVPVALDRLVRGCLAKDRDDRWQDARDLRRTLDGIADESGQTLRVLASDLADQPPPAWTWSVGRVTLMAGLVALALAAALAPWGSLSSTAPRPLVHSVIPIAPAEELAGANRPQVAISPDGSRIAFSGARAGGTQIYVRTLDRPEAEPVPGTENGTQPFFSPDGQSLGFWADGTLKKVAVRGGAPVTLCSQCSDFGSSWSANDTIVLGAGYRGLARISAAGGSESRLTEADKARRQRTIRFPEVLPGGNAVVFTAAGWDEETYDDARIEVLSLETGEKKVLIEGGAYARYASTGHLVYGRAGSLFAVAFDPVRLEVKGAPIAVLEGVSTQPLSGSAQFALSTDGTLVYAPGRAMGIQSRLVWADRQGRIEAAGDITRAFYFPRLSPDGQRVAVTVEGAMAHLAVYDVARGILTRLTREDENVWTKAWTPDGKRLAYSVGAVGGSGSLRWQLADGSAPPEELTRGSLDGSWSPDGGSLVFVRPDPTTQLDLWLLPLEGERTARPLLPERFDQRSPAISPNGRWMAYVSEESGRPEVFVRAFPGLGQKVPVSARGGHQPRWSRDGGELFYREPPNRLMVSQIRTRPTLAVSKATIAFEDKEGRYLNVGYDVAADGRFLLVDENENYPRQLNLVQNFLEEVKRVAPH